VRSSKIGLATWEDMTCPTGYHIQSKIMHHPCHVSLLPLPLLSSSLICSVATVFKAVCTATSLKVIIKAYYKQKMHPKHIHKLHREIAAMKMLNGPYVAEFYCTFEDAQCMYIIMEYCEGGDLFKTMLMHGGLLDEQWVCVEVSKLLIRFLLVCQIQPMSFDE
jgi:hypothetical protein